MGLRISPSAVDFIKRTFEAESVEKVLVVTGFVVGSLRELDGDDWDKRPLQDLEQIARKGVEELPSKVMIEYSIGTKELNKVPREYVRVVDGIKCCLPDDLIETIGDREIVVDKGVLRFEPALEPFELKRGQPITSTRTARLEQLRSAGLARGPAGAALCYEGPDYGKPHAGISPHYHIYEMQRRRGDNVCQWKYLGGKYGRGVLKEIPPGMQPCSSYPNFVGRGG